MLTDTKDGYGSVSIALHWIGAAFVVALWLLGNRLDDLPRGPELIAARNLHFGVGVLAFGFIAARIAWRLVNRTAGPGHAAASTILERVAYWVQVGLLVTLAVLIVTGPVSIWAGGRAIDVFGWQLASPLPRIDGLHEGLEVVHKIASKVILVLVGLHVAGALKHIVLDRDGVMRRMLVPVRMK